MPQPSCPAVWCGWQPGFGARPAVGLWTLTVDLPDHPCHSTVTTATVRAAGYVVQEPPEEEASC